MNKPLLLVVSFLLSQYFSGAQMPSGGIAEYKLNNDASDTKGNYSGSLSNTSSIINRFGDANSATMFTAGSSTGSLPVALITAMQNDFTMGFWFNTTMNAGSSGQWYGGSALIDAEVCGGTNDWGTALIDGGKVCMGIGNGDVTIKSTASGYNDGNWHYITVTRNRTAGKISLYVEGVQVATTSGVNTNALNAPNSLRLASNPCNPTGVYTGSLDDIVIYNRELSNADITQLYMYSSAVALPLHWLSFTSEITGSKVTMKWQVDNATNSNTFFIEHSTDGINFSAIGTLEIGAALYSDNGKSMFVYADDNLQKGKHFYRIRESDVNNKSSYSRIIQVTVGGTVAGISIQSNPAAEELVLLNSSKSEIKQILIADLSGRILLNRQSQTSDAVIRLNISMLHTGYYVVKVIEAYNTISVPLIRK